MSRPKRFSNTTTISLDKNVRSNFERLYPECFSMFIRRALSRALNSKDFFDEVFWYREVSDESISD